MMFKCYKQFPVFISHNFAVKSSDPFAIDSPFGEKAMEFT